MNKLALTAHVMVSVGWLGAVAAYLALAIAGLTSHDVHLVRGAYRSMGLIAWYVIVPFSLTALLTGLIQSLGTRWGVFRHWWVLVKFLLTTGGVIVLLQHLKVVSRISVLAARTTFPSPDDRVLRIQLVLHAVGAVVVLLAATTLSVYKPWGLTSYGRRHALAADLPRHPPFNDDVGAGPHQRVAFSRPGWAAVVGIHAIGLVAVVIGWHIANGGLRGH